MVIELTSYAEAREAFRSRRLRQALYDEGKALMDGVIVNLHGDEHVARRRLENRLFRRDTFAWYERDRIPVVIDQVLAGIAEAGRVDLLSLARQTMVTLALDVAGVDRPTGSADEMARLFSLMDEMARAATVVHATGDKEAIKAAGVRALGDFEREFFEHSLRRRADLVAAQGRGGLDAAALPRDVLTTLLVNHDQLDLPYETILREIAYYPWVGAHSTANQFVHAMHHLLTWIDAYPTEVSSLVEDAGKRQRFVHESIRLHPASPVALRTAEADVVLETGRLLPAGELVIIGVEEANRDPVAVGPEPTRFRPDRALATGVAPWGLSFGTGTHACLGMELAAGLDPAADSFTSDAHLVGVITIMAGVMLRAGARTDPDDPPTQDAATSRSMWGRYPVLLG